MNWTRIFSGIISLCAGIIFLSSCESNRWFQSEDKLKSKIQTTWSLVKINHNQSEEDWTFKEGKVCRFVGNTSDTIDVGNYSVSTTITRAFLSMTDFQNPVGGQNTYNAQWEIIELDKGLLYIVTDRDGSTSLTQKEFTEKK